MSWVPWFLSSDTHWTYMNAHKSKLLYKPSFLSTHFFLSSVLIPPPLGFLTTFFVQNLKFQKVFTWILNLNLLSCFGHAKWQIQGGFIIVPLPYWTGRASKQVASWFLPPLACLGLKVKYFFFVKMCSKKPLL